MAKRLVIDLYKCEECDRCNVECSYFYRASASDHGMLTLREYVTFAVVCRRCEEPACIAACPFHALEKQADGILKRYNLRCVSCKSCSCACPFGTIYPELLPFYVTQCDLCLKLKGKTPECVLTCSKKALSYEEVKEDPSKEIFIIGDNLAVRAPKWSKVDIQKGK